MRSPYSQPASAPLPQFESQFEEKLYAQRQEKLTEIQRLGGKLDLTPLESIYPNRFPAADEQLQLSQIPELLAKYDDETHPVSAEQLDTEKPEVAVAGRLMSLRVQGKAGFAHLQGGGKRLQIYVRRDDVGEDIFALYKLLDLGDHIGVRGTLMRTRTGELTLKALPNSQNTGKPAISFLAKAMLALPDKYHGLEDVELRYRQRYVDLIMNSGTLAKAENSPTSGLSSRSEAEGSAFSPTTDLSSRPEAQSAGVERPAVPPPGTSAVTDTAAPNEEHNDAPRNVREVFVKRAAILRAIRKFFDNRGYLEVETPMMHTIAGGAAARPFKTHHNALDIPLNLRIAPELYLKRLVVGGLDRVYEINRNFRNEGISTQHNPEFTMLEFYQAYANYHDLMDLTQELLRFVAMEVNGTTRTWFNGAEIDLGHWQKLSMIDAIIKFWEEDFGSRPSRADFLSRRSFFDLLSSRLAVVPQPAENELAEVGDKKYAPFHTLSFASQVAEASPTTQGYGAGIAFLFEHFAEEHLIYPTIIYDFPLAVSPLSKVKPDEPDWVERFEFYIGGFEVGNAFSELNDPADQERRFEAQLAERERGDEEAMAEMDEDYVRALGYGLPPTAGEGIGIDRLTMLLTGSRSIRDVILFPLMRPRTNTAEAAAVALEAEAAAYPHGESAE